VDLNLLMAKFLSLHVHHGKRQIITQHSLTERQISNAFQEL